MQISFFQGFPAKGQPHVPTKEIGIEDLLGGIKHGTWSEQIGRVRAIEDKAKRSAAKRSIPAVTISGTFTERHEGGLIKHSGLIAIDVDGWSDKTPLIADPYTFALFKSVGGNGLCVIVKIAPDKHKESFRWLQHYYFASYGIAIDPAPSNPASLRFVSHDPDLFYNTKAHRAKTRAEPKSQKSATMPLVLSTDQVSELCKEVAGSGIDIAPDYDTYLKLALSVASGFGESGRELFHYLCIPSPKYNSEQADRKYSHALEEVAKGRCKVTVGTLYWLLNRAGVKLPQAGQRAVQVTALGKATGRKPEAMVEQLVTINGISESQARHLVNEVMQRDDIDLSRVASDQANLIEMMGEWLTMNHPIRKNAVTCKLEENGSEVTEERLNSIYLRARTCFNKTEVTFDLVNRMIFSDMTPTFNPFLEHIDRNRFRNSAGHIDRLARTIKTDTEGAAVFIRKWVISWIAAISGHPVRSVLCLVGGQNTGKTEWFRRLPPGPMQKYYAESKLDAGKDDELLMCQKLWVMDDEMGGKSKQDEKRFKELTSKSTFSLRAAYARYNQDYKRIAVLCGTSNEAAVVNDPTGNTRILPINVLSIDHEAYNAIDKDELFMEAVRAYESGEDWLLTKDDLAVLDSIGSDFEPIPFERELILRFFAPIGPDDLVQYFTATEIKDIIETNTRQRIMSMSRFGIELRKAFGESQRRKRSGSVQRVYTCRRIEQHEQYPAYQQVKEDVPF